MIPILPLIKSAVLFFGKEKAKEKAVEAAHAILERPRPQTPRKEEERKEGHKKPVSRISERLLMDLERSEGFRGTPYKDDYGHPTIGIGTLLPLSLEEGKLLLAHRMKKYEPELRKGLEKRFSIDYDELPQPAAEGLLDMLYNMGAPHLWTFVRMFAAMKRGDWQKVHDEALDSRYFSQVGERARRVAARFLECKK